jgi:hypothetical protein
MPALLVGKVFPSSAFHLRFCCCFMEVELRSSHMLGKHSPLSYTTSPSTSSCHNTCHDDWNSRLPRGVMKCRGGRAPSKGGAG